MTEQERVFLDGLATECGYDSMTDTGIDSLIDYKDALEGAFSSTVEELRGYVSTPGMSGADVFEAVSALVARLGFEPYDYDDPANPYAEREEANSDA